MTDEPLHLLPRSRRAQFLTTAVSAHEDFAVATRTHRAQRDSEAGVRRWASYQRFGKPVFDRVVGAVLLVAVLPVIVLVAAAVSVSLGAPILIRQRRVGLHGRDFTVFKFRTMHPTRRARDVPYNGPDRRETHKHPDDPRLTRLGRVLRQLSLDELPQLINVLRGEMSLVGPRPELPMIVHRYAAWQHRRHVVKPGLTGLWQVSERGNGMMHEHVDVDLAYVEQLSFRTDLGILLRTPLAALGKRKGC